MYTFTCQFEVKSANVLFWPVWPSLKGAYMLLRHAHVSSHSQLQLIKYGGGGIHGDAAESSRRWAEPRWLMGDVVRRRSRHIQMCVKYSLHSKTTRCFKAESDCKDTRAPCDVRCYQKLAQSYLSWAVVWWGEAPICWSTGGITTQEEKERTGRKKKGGREVLYSLVFLNAIVFLTHCARFYPAVVRKAEGI